MTNEEVWMRIPSGDKVNVAGHVIIKLADQWERYTGINEHCFIELNGDGRIHHISELIHLFAPYKGHFS